MQQHAKWPPVAFDGLEVVHDGNTESSQAVKDGENSDVPLQLSEQCLQPHAPSHSLLLSLQLANIYLHILSAVALFAVS